jgi:hypothetical protein
MVWLIVVVNSILPYHRSLVTHGQPLNSQTDNLTGFCNTFQWAIQTLPMVVQGKADPMAGHNMAGMSEAGMGSALPQLHIVTPAGEQARLTFTPAKSGEYPFLCILPGHSEQGVLVVG